MKINILLILSLITLSAKTYSQTPTVIDAEFLNSRFEHIKTELVERNYVYDYTPAEQHKHIKSEDFNQNFLKILLVDPSITLYTFAPLQAIELGKVMYNFNQINNLINTKLSKVACSLPNGVGFKYFDKEIKDLGPCLVDSCSPGFYPSENKLSCIENYSIACTNQLDESSNIIGYGFYTYDFDQDDEVCQINSCASLAYSLNPETQSCECTDPDSCFVPTAKVNTDLAEVNQVLNEANQPSLALMPEGELNPLELNASLSEIKKYDPNHLISTLPQSKITNLQWDMQKNEAIRIATAYKSLCENFTLFGESISSSPCDLSQKIQANIDFLNQYFPFYGEAVVSTNVADQQFLPYTTINNLINAFNNKTNKNTAIPDYLVNSTISTGNLNTKFANLRSNIQLKLESALGVFTNPYVSNTLGTFNAQETNRYQTLAFKTKTEAHPNVSVTAQNGSVCLRNEYCKITFGSTHNTDSFPLATIESTSNQGIVTTIPINLGVIDEYVAAPSRPGKYGCYNAGPASHINRNIWACGPGKNACRDICYNQYCTRDINATFAAYNTEGKYQYSGYTRGTADLRSGCSGDYVYQVTVYYYRQQYHLTP